MTFNTGNNVPSTDPRDLYDNAENLDKLVNGADPFYPDRKGILRQSWAGMENDFDTSQEGRETAFTLSQADKESRFQAFLVSSGYVSKGDYAAGVVLAERNEYVAVGAATTGTSPGLYRPNASATLPLTLTGTWATDSANLVLLGDDVLRQELAAPAGAGLVGLTSGMSVADLIDPDDPAKGAALVGYRGRKLFEALSEVVSVKDHGAKGDGVTNDYAAFVAAIDRVQAVGGGRVRIPAGRYKIDSQLELRPIASLGWHNVILEGDGPGITVLDFSGAPAGTDGLAIYGWGGRLGIVELSVEKAPAVGISFNKGEVRGGPNWISRVFMRDVIVDGCGADGLRFLQVYMGGFENVESRNNASIGFNLQGFQTSMLFTRCWAGGDASRPNGGNADIGWFINGMTYGQFIGCSADWNAGPGWLIQNVAGMTLSACGSESNGQEGFLLRTRTLDTDGLPEICKNINGLIIDGCFALNNSKAEPSLYANFLGAVTADGRPMEFVMRANVDIDEVGIPTSLVLSGASGAVIVHEQANKFSGGSSASGNVSRQNNSVVGRSVLVRLSADQSIPNVADTAVAFSTITTNRLGASISSGAVLIPAGVNRVKVTAGGFWADNSAGARVLRMVKNGSAFAGSAQQKNTGAGFTAQNLTSAIFEVTPGDTIGLIAFQDSGGPLNLINNGSTFLSVEAIG